MLDLLDIYIPRDHFAKNAISYSYSPNSTP